MDGNNKLVDGLQCIVFRQSKLFTVRCFLSALILIIISTISFNSLAQTQPQVKPQSQTSNENTLSGINMEDFGQQTEGKIVWRENPFVQPANDIAVTDLVLTGIVYNENNAAAIINNEIVNVGDRVGVSQVIAIEKERIILRNENGIFSLSIGGR